MYQFMRFFLFTFLVFPLIGKAQIYESIDCDISFFSEAPFQDVAASNHQAVSYYDVSTGYVLFDVMVEDFQFEQGLMEQHFNDRYLESNEYPKAEFFGKVLGFNPGTQNLQEVTAIGDLTIHGITNRVKSVGKMRITEEGYPHLTSKFSINIEDYSVDAPRLLLYPVAEVVDIKVEAYYHLTGS